MCYWNANIITIDSVIIQIGKAFLDARESGRDSKFSFGDSSVEVEAADDEVAVRVTLLNITSPKLTLYWRHLGAGFIAVVPVCNCI